MGVRRAARGRAWEAERRRARQEQKRLRQQLASRAREAAQLASEADTLRRQQARGERDHAQQLARMRHRVRDASLHGEELREDALADLEDSAAAVDARVRAEAASVRRQEEARLVGALAAQAAVREVHHPTLLVAAQAAAV